jgi:hypothetical protein
MQSQFCDNLQPYLPCEDFVEVRFTDSLGITGMFDQINLFDITCMFRITGVFGMTSTCMLDFTCIFGISMFCITIKVCTGMSII